MQNQSKNREKYYGYLTATPELAELIGILLGDGHVQKFPRTDRIVITCASNKTR